MRAPHYRRNKKVSYSGISTERLIIILIIVIAVTTFIFNRNINNAVLPPTIEKSINFTAYVPPLSDNGFYKVSSESISFSKETGVLAFSAVTKDGNKISITQQSEPDSFSDVPQYYSKLLDKLNQYSEFQTNIGTVTLTKPKELSGGQSAVSTSGGTLIFAHPERNMTDDQWKDFFNSLESVK